MSSNTVEQSKNVSLKKMEQSGQRKSVTDQDKKLNPNANTFLPIPSTISSSSNSSKTVNNDNKQQSSNINDNNNNNKIKQQINNGNDESLSSPTKETKFNNTSILSPQSTKSLNLTDDNNSNHSTNTNVTTSTTASSPSHPNINRTFIKNSKLTPNANTSRYNYVQSTQSQQQQNNNNARPEQKCKENQNESKQKMLPFDNELIRAQIEYLFSDYHLTNDTYLLARMQDNPQHWLSIDELCHNQKIRCLTIKKDRILRALRESKYLQLSPEQDKVRRPDFTLPKLKPNRDLRRTVFLYGIPSNKTETDIRKLLSQYGHIKRIHFQPTGDGLSSNDKNGNDQNIDDEAPNKAVAQLIMKKKFLFPSRYSQSDHDTDNESHKGFDVGTPKGSMDGNQSDSSRTGRMSDYTHPVRNPNGDAQDFSHLKTCFVVFESQSQATKCVKARVRAIDGMRCIHKYDYNKVAKKFRTAQMKGEKLSFSPPPPNYQSPRVSSEGKYMPRGRSPGAQSDNGRYGNYNNNRYNNRRNFGNGNNGNNYGRGNRDYNSYRDRSHSQSSQGSNRGDRDYDNRNNNNNGYQSQRHGRYQRNNNNNGNYRSQTPNYKSHSNNNNQNNAFYNRFKGNNDDNDKENRGQRSRGLGSRRDRDSHDGSQKEPSSDVRYHSNRSDRNKWNNNPTYNRNQRQAQSTSPQRGQPHSAHNSVGNQSTMSANSEYKPILNSMNKQNQNGQDNKQHGKPQQDIRKVQQSQGPVKPPQHNKVADVANQPTYAKKRQPVRAATPNMTANGSFVSPPQLSPHEVLSPPTDLKQTQSSVQVGNNPSTQKKMPKQPLQRSVSANTAPISTKSNKEPAAPQLYHPIGAAPTLPTREDIAALKAAGYNHELCYLPIDDANFMAGLDDLYHDPLIAYDAYFGVDQSGKPTSTHAAAQQLQQQQQTKASSRNQRTHNQHSHSGQYSSSQRSSQHSQHAQHSQSSSQQYYVPQQSRHNIQQQYAQTPTHHSSHSQQQYAQQSQYGQQQNPSLTTHSYSAHSYQQNGPSSAPYGPVTTNNNQNTGQQWRAEQWQLDKLEKFKAQKQAEQAAQHHQQQQQPKPVTALSVLSSHN